MQGERQSKQKRNARSNPFHLFQTDSSQPFLTTYLSQIIEVGIPRLIILIYIHRLCAVIGFLIQFCRRLFLLCNPYNINKFTATPISLMDPEFIQLNYKILCSTQFHYSSIIPNLNILAILLMFVKIEKVVL